MVHPYITASEPSSILYYLELNSGNRPVDRFAEGGGGGGGVVVSNMPSPFYIASVVLFQLHRCVVSPMQGLVTPLISVHNNHESN